MIHRTASRSTELLSSLAVHVSGVGLANERKEEELIHLDEASVRSYHVVPEESIFSYLLSLMIKTMHNVGG